MRCSLNQPISVVAYHGTADRSVRYGGGSPAVALDGQARTDRSAAESVGTFIRADECSEVPSAFERTGAILVERWEPCRSGAAAVLYTIEGGGHAWPGGQPGFAGADMPTSELSASETMWTFFAAHPKAR